MPFHFDLLTRLEEVLLEMYRLSGTEPGKPARTEDGEFDRPRRRYRKPSRPAFVGRRETTREKLAKVS